MDRYAVVGNPVAHSLSPAIHAHFAKRTGEAIEYGAMLVAHGRFDPEMRRFFDAGGRGVNVTLPFKVDAFSLAERASERARVAAAANFLALREGRIEADNTDGAGLVNDLAKNLRFALRGRSILIVGAGGAARGVIAPLLAEQPARLVVANRTLERARELERHFASRGRVEAVALDAIPADNFDLVLNATSTSTRAETLPLPPRVLESAALAYDMAYGAAARPFLERARARGAQASDGLGMLVEQAAESFFLWRGKRPETAEILAELRLSFA